VAVKNRKEKSEKEDSEKNFEQHYFVFVSFIDAHKNRLFSKVINRFIISFALNIVNYYFLLLFSGFDVSISGN